MQLREYHKSDIKGIMLLHDEFEHEFFTEFDTSHYEERQKQDLDEINRYYLMNSRKFWVIEHEREIIGLVGMQTLGEKTAELIRMRVKKEYRGHGLGNKLLKTVEDYCRQIKIEKIILHTAKRLLIAKKMYENHGFKLYEEQVVQTSAQFVKMSYYKDLIDQ